jgi:hypothetical protein
MLLLQAGMMEAGRYAGRRAREGGGFPVTPRLHTEAGSRPEEAEYAVAACLPSMSGPKRGICKDAIKIP